jgi:hypothetical protein
MASKTLIIGTYSVQGVDSFDWFQDLPYLPDYDTVVLDATRIFNFWSLSGRLKSLRSNEYLLSDISDIDRKVRSNLEIVKNKLLEMLEFEKSIYVLYTQPVVINAEFERKIYAGHGSSEFLKTNEWCPVSIDTVVEKGNVINVKDESYKEYFKIFRAWEYYFVVATLNATELEINYEDEWKVVTKWAPIATNSANKPIAICIVPFFYEWDKEELSRPSDRRGYHEKPKKMGGRLILLPAADKYHTEQSMEAILAMGRRFEETPPPAWTTGIEVPGEAGIRTAITAQKESVRCEQTRLKELEDLLAKVERYKRLLYADGLELQDICKLTLDSLGVTTKSPLVSDFMIEIGSEEALVEVKGSTKNIDKDDVAQLITDFGQLIKTIKETKTIKRLLIGNAWRLEPLEKRGTKDKPLFTKDVIKIAESQNIGLLPTTELFKVYCVFLEKPTCRDSILSKLITGTGIIRF